MAVEAIENDRAWMIQGRLLLLLLLRQLAASSRGVAVAKVKLAAAGRVGCGQKGGLSVSARTLDLSGRQRTWVVWWRVGDGLSTQEAFFYAEQGLPL
ncbi:MAG: hypothetical protein ACKO8I_07695 [Cyanobacteriota bacterium]